MITIINNNKNFSNYSNDNLKYIRRIKIAKVKKESRKQEKNQNTKINNIKNKDLGVWYLNKKYFNHLTSTREVNWSMDTICVNFIHPYLHVT